VRVGKVGDTAVLELGTKGLLERLVHVGTLRLLEVDDDDVVVGVAQGSAAGVADTGDLADTREDNLRLAKGHVIVGVAQGSTAGVADAWDLRNADRGL